MIYLDYSATTPVSEEVLDTFCRTCLDFPGNSNSLHKLGVESKQLEVSATKQIANILGIKEDEIIYTSGSSESNNLAIKGICLKYQNRGKHIITTNLEHSSIYGPIGYLQKQGFTVDFVKTDEKGIVDLADLESLMREDTVLVTIASVNSETGLRQPIEQIGQFLKQYPKCFFHVDMTQSIGKIEIPLNDIDLVSFSAHKFYGLKGIGVLVKKEKIELEPLIHGGKSSTVYRSGTPALPLIVSLSKALRLAVQDLDKKYEHIEKLNLYIREKLKQYQGVTLNVNENTIYHMLNISVLNIKPETMLHALENYNIYISTQSACSSGNQISKAVLELTKDELRASHSIRISLSSLTTIQEVDQFLNAFDECYHHLLLNKN